MKTHSITIGTTVWNKMDNFSKNERTETTDVVICNSDYSSKTFEPCRVHTDGQVYFRLRCKVRNEIFFNVEKATVDLSQSGCLSPRLLNS